MVSLCISYSESYPCFVCRIVVKSYTEQMMTVNNHTIVSWFAVTGLIRALGCKHLLQQTNIKAQQ